MKLITSQLLSAATLAVLLAGARADIIEITSDVTTDTRWTRDNVYVIQKTTYVRPPAKLTIEPGTLIRGLNPDNTGFTNSAGTIAVCRGAKIIANGTVEQPIIFTSADDTLVPGGANTKPATIPAASGNIAAPSGNYSTTGATGAFNNAFSHGRECGGLVILGRTPIAYDGNGATARLKYDDATGVFSGEQVALPTGAPSPEAVSGTTNEAGNGVGFAIIEGLSADAITVATPIDPDASYLFDSDGTGPNPATTISGIAASTSFQRGVYGGTDENDNSGVVRFFQLRYGGFPIAVGIEINGLTMGAVGRGTVIEWVEVSNNADDCFEWFGGYNNCRYLFGMHSGDDGLDWDQGYSGTIQHALIHQGGSRFGRTNFGVAAETTAGKNLSLFSPERGMELDGPEPNSALVQPRSKGWVFNVTFIGNKGGSGAGSADDGMRVRRGSSGQVSYALFEDFASGVLEQSDNPTTAGYENDTDLLDSLYFNMGTTPFGSLTGTTIVTTGTAAAAATQLKAPAAQRQLHKNGMDLTLIDAGTANATARTLTRAIPSRPGLVGFLSPTRHVGGMRDNNWLFGWSWTHRAELLPTSNIARPVLSLSIDGSNNPVISFNADTTVVDSGDVVQYIVERSIDGVAWSPICATFDGATADAPTMVNADSDSDTGEITVTDSTFTYSGTPVHYRVIAQ